MTNRSIFRFAPSPNGALHLGHALSAFVTHDMAHETGGRFLLRVEDIDIERCHPEYEAQMLDDLAWLGLTWEEPVRRQSQHFETYAQALGKLEAMGLLYPCFASRKEISAHAKTAHNDPDGAPIYPGLHKGLSNAEIDARKDAGEAFALRLHMDKAIEMARTMSSGPLSFRELDPVNGEIETRAAEPERWGDAVIARKDVPTSYHLAVVVDDAGQDVTHVTRGQDLYAATGIHRLLQVLLALPEPTYHHHALLCDEAGRKLSKNHKDKALASLRAEGATPEDIRRMAGIAKA